MNNGSVKLASFPRAGVGHPLSEPITAASVSQLAHWRDGRPLFVTKTEHQSCPRRVSSWFAPEPDVGRGQTDSSRNPDYRRNGVQRFLLSRLLESGIKPTGVSRNWTVFVIHIARASQLPMAGFEGGREL